MRKDLAGMAITNLGGIPQVTTWQSAFAQAKAANEANTKPAETITEEDEKVNGVGKDKTETDAAAAAAGRKKGEEEEKPFDLQKMLEEAMANKLEIKAPPPTDDTGKLTARLVAATGQMEVRQVIAQASKNMLGLRAAAVASSGPEAEKAKAILRKIEKLIDRASRKIEDLNKEDMLKIQQKRAEQQKRGSRADEIKTELRRKMRERMNRERTYLNDTEGKKGGVEDLLRPANAGESTAPKLDAASEAQIAIEAEAQAAAEVGSAGGGDAGGAGVDSGAASGGSSNTGSAASGGAAEGGGEVAAEGASVDISA